MLKEKNKNIFIKDLNKGWKAAIVDKLYIDGKLEKNIFVHAKLIHRHSKDDEEDLYYEIMTPTANFQISYVTAERIRLLDEE